MTCVLNVLRVASGKTKCSTCKVCVFSAAVRCDAIAGAGVAFLSSSTVGVGVMSSSVAAHR